MQILNEVGLLVKGAPALWTGFLFVCGSIIGSFLNVVILRGMRGEDIVRQPSHCPRCQKKLAWYELVPIISYLWLRGKCQGCSQPISAQYPLVESMIGLSAAVILSRSIDITAALIFISICLLLVLAVVDLRTMLLPDKYMVILLVASLMFAYLNIPTYPFTYSLAAAGMGAGFLGLIWLVTRGQGIGLGDVKLMVPVGLLLGLSGTITTLFVAFMLGGIVGTYLLLMKRATAKTAVPFGPFLAGAAIICLLFPPIINRFITFLGWSPI